MLAVWIYLAVALVISLSAFGLAQIAAGSGMVFVILATTLWTGYAVHRARGAGRQS